MKTRLQIFVVWSLCSAFVRLASAQPATTTRLDIDAENIVSYTTDTFDASKFATESNLTTVQPAPRNFAFVMAVGDIVAVNGKPARGSLVVRQQAISLNTAPPPGQAVA